jgi:competence protein ComEC
MATAPSGAEQLSAPPENIWRAPLVPAALACTAGIVLDRYLSPPLIVSLILAVACVLAWWIASAGPRSGLPLVYLALAGMAFGAAYHHYRRDFYPIDDIGAYAGSEPAPVQLRGRLDEEPFHLPPAPPDPLRSMASTDVSTTVLRVTHLRQDDAWREVSGRVRVRIAGAISSLHAGDEVEMVGQLSKIAGPANPGEFDVAGHWRDQGVRARLMVRHGPGGVTRLARGWPVSFQGWLAVIRGGGQRILRESLPERTQGLAMALLLGDGAPMTAADWDKYVSTGVIHVLAISGQHLVVLAIFLSWGFRGWGLRRRYSVAIIALFLLFYALVTGGRPPALRSAIMVCAASAGIILRRPTMPANLFALAWLSVALLNPTDLFSAGCQLSFLSVAILVWGTRSRAQRERDPLDMVLDESRPLWLRSLRWMGRQVGESYLIAAIIWLAITPLAASRYHLISPIGILIGPILTLLTTFALIAGFLLLLAALIWLPLASLLAPIVHGLLTACEFLVDHTIAWPGSHIYIGDIYEWWLWVFYLALLAALTQEGMRRRWRWAMSAGLGWLCVGLLGGAARLPGDELRCTFLAVGHGGCTVLETPDRRTLLYDAGALSGPEVTQRVIAPFLWQRGISRIDEIFLSHADLDHFNGLIGLLDRFAVGQVTCTPSFADKEAPGVRHTLNELQRRRVPVRIVKAGDQLHTNEVNLEVLHPPLVGPEGNENARSLVLKVTHAGHTILLTGDLEGAGLQRVLRLPRPRLDIFMAPHHGSPLTNTADLADWARPRVVVACNGPRHSLVDVAKRYTPRGAEYLSTWSEGAITVRSHASGMVVETFVTGQRFVLRTE